MEKCKFCGETLNKNAKFCSDCGKEISYTALENSSEETSKLKLDNHIGMPPDENDKTEKNKIKLVAIILAASLFIMIVLLIILNLKNGSSKTEYEGDSYSEYNLNTYSKIELSSSRSAPQNYEQIQKMADDMTYDDIELIVGQFYQSYLACINSRNLELLQGNTSNVMDEVATRFSAPGNIQFYFEYIGCEPIVSTRYNSVDEDTPSVELDVTFNYKYWDREGTGEKSDGTNVQRIQLIFVDNAWLVNKFVHHGR